MTMFLVSSVWPLPSSALTSTCPARVMRAMPEERVDLVLLEQEADAVDVGVDRVVLVLHHRGEIELRLADTTMPSGAKSWPASSNISEACSSALEGMQPMLRQVPPMRLALLDDGDLHAELRGADGAHIAAGAGADDDKVVGHD